MPRTRPVNCPNLRNITGRSFGPTTINATTPITSNSIQPMSGMNVPSRLALQHPDHPGATLAGLAVRLGGHVTRGGAIRVGGRGILDFFGGILHTALERRDSLADLAHQACDLAAAKQNQDNNGN